MAGQVLKDAGGDGATKKLAQRRLNNTVVITNHLGLQNHPSQIRKLLSAPGLTAPLAEISALTRTNKATVKFKTGTAVMDLAPVALLKPYRKLAGIVAKLKKNGLCAIAFWYFRSMFKSPTRSRCSWPLWRGPLPHSLVSSLRPGRLLQRVPHCPWGRVLSGMGPPCAWLLYVYSRAAVY